MLDFQQGAPVFITGTNLFHENYMSVEFSHLIIYMWHSKKGLSVKRVFDTGCIIATMIALCYSQAG